MTDSGQAPELEKMQRALSEAAAMHNQLTSCFTDLAATVSAAARAIRQGNKLLFCGNGGSAAEAQHIATVFVVRLSSQRNRPPLAAIALTTDTSLLTACANDLGFDHVFARQVEALMHSGDVLFLLSTSGASSNLLEAARAARKVKGFAIGFLGQEVTPLDELVDFALHIPSRSSQRVQEGHLFCGHLLVEFVEDLLAQPNEHRGEEHRIETSQVRR